MANYTHTVTLTAKDGITTAFKAAGAAGRQMGADIAAGAGQATSALAGEANAAAKASSSVVTLEKATDRAGVAHGEFATKASAAVGVMGKLGSTAASQQQALAGLTRSYGDATGQILEFANAMQSSTSFSNDDVIAAAQIASTLQRNYGLTIDEVEQLIAASADLAAVNGTTLEDAVMRTSSAIRGEAESAEALGLTMNQQAIDSQNLTQSMSNEEAAHFRLNALLQQSAYARGAAADQAGTLNGQMQQGANAANDFAQGVANIAGPLGQVVGPFGDLVELFPMLTAGAGKAVTGLGRMVSALKASGTAMGVLEFATGPVGIALGGLALVTAAAMKAQADAEQQVNDYRESLENLGTTINDIPDLDVRVNIQKIQTSQGLGIDIDTSVGIDEEGESVNELAQAYDRLAKARQDFYNKAGDFVAATQVTADMQKNYELDFQQVTAINNAIADGMANAGDEADDFAAASARLEKAHYDGFITGDKYVQMQLDLAKAMKVTGDGADEEREAALKQVDAWLEATTTYDGTSESLAKISSTGDMVLKFLSILAPQAQNVADIFADKLNPQLANAEDIMGRLATMKGLEGQSARYNAMADDQRYGQSDANVEAYNDEQARQEAITKAAIDGAEDRKKAEDEAKQWWAEQQLEHTQDIVDGIQTEQSAREDLAQKLVDIEQDKNDQIESLNEQLASDLEGIAQERASVEQDLADKLADINKQEAETQKQTAKDIAGVEKDRVAAVKDAEQDLAATTRDLQHQRLEAERDLAATLKDLDQQRVEVAEQTQEKLADLAQQRADIEQQAADAIAAAQEDYAESVADTADQIKAVQDQLREATKAAAEEWRQQVAENRKAIAEIKSDLSDDLGDNKEDYRRANEDRDIERQRLKEDLANTLADPDISNKDKDAAILEYQRRMQDLEREQQRADADYAEQQKEARQQAAEEEKRIRQEQRAARKQAAEEEKAAREAAQEQIKAIQEAEMEALKKLNEAKEKAHEQEAEQLADLAEQQSSILEDQAKQFEEINQQKADAEKETAREIAEIQKEQARAQAQYERDIATAQRDADRARKDALRDQARQLADLEKGRQDAVQTANSKIVELDKKASDARKKYAEGVQTAQEDAGEAGQDAVEEYAKAVEDLPDEVTTLLTVDSRKAQTDLDGVVTTMGKVGRGVRGVATLTVNKSSVEQAINDYNNKHVATAYVDLKTDSQALNAAALARTVATALDLTDPDTGRVDPTRVDVYKTPRATNPNLGTTAVDRAMALGGPGGIDSWGSGTTTLTPGAGARAGHPNEPVVAGPTYIFNQPVTFQVATPNLNKELARQLQARGLG